MSTGSVGSASAAVPPGSLCDLAISCYTSALPGTPVLFPGLASVRIMAGTSSLRLEGRVAVVTGGGRGIGRAIARRFAAEGAAVVIAQRDPATLERTAEEIRGAGGRVLAVPTDVSREESCDTLVAATIQEFGGLDILVSNAAIASPQKAPFPQMTTQTWQETLGV